MADHLVVFTPSGRRGQFEDGTTVLEAARRRGVDIDSVCGGRGICGRCQIDLIPVAEEVERRLHDLPKKLTIAVMGCAVNGPGEAREADIGIAGGKGEGLLFRRGEVVRKVPADQLADVLVEEARRMAEEGEP